MRPLGCNLFCTFIGWTFYSGWTFLDALASLDFKLSVSDICFSASASTGLSELFTLYSLAWGPGGRCDGRAGIQPGEEQNYLERYRQNVKLPLGRSGGRRGHSATQWDQNPHQRPFRRVHLRRGIPLQGSPSLLQNTIRLDGFQSV